MGCCSSTADAVAYVKEELDGAIDAIKAAPPIELSYGYARDVKPDTTQGQTAIQATTGIFELVNKSGKGECICIVVAQNAGELAFKKSRDIKGYLTTHLGFLPDQTVMRGRFDAGNTDKMQIAVYCGGTTVTPDYQLVLGAVGSHNVKHTHFKEVKVFQMNCMGKNILLKYKGVGDLQPQKGQGFLGRRTSLGAGIDMSSNITELEPVIA